MVMELTTQLLFFHLSENVSESTVYHHIPVLQNMLLAHILATTTKPNPDFLHTHMVQYSSTPPVFERVQQSMIGRCRLCTQG